MIERLGAGGMGEVYRARDTKLDRDVAIKVLPPALASDPARLVRLEREAKLLASVNHPHIATIHNLEEVDGTRFLVLELVEGESLERRLARGPLAVEEALAVCGQIARALEAAHHAGVVHRDLKPANVLITPAGAAKVLDFGVAKSLLSDRQAGETAQATELTGLGTIVGTAPYMSPEQVRGAGSDKRSDIWALGCVMYEALTGRKAFARDTVAETLSAVLEHEPDLDSLPPATPSSMRRLIARCLRKDADSRLHDVADARIEIDDACEALREATRSGPARSSSAPGGARRLVPKLVMTGLAVASIAVVAAVAWLWSESPSPVAPAIVVLPFENIGTAENEYFAAGMTEEITAGLSALSGLRVISRRGALRYVDTELTTREIGEELDVDYVLTATVRWDAAGDGPERFRIIPALVRVADDSRIWSERFDGVNEDIFEVQGRIGSEVIERLGVTLLEGESSPLSAPATRNSDAFDLYLRGRYFWNKRTEEDIRLALAAFQEAVRLDPSYATAWVGIADVWIFRGWYSVLAPQQTFPNAKDAVNRALAIDSSLAEARTSLAHIHLEFDHDWEAAEREYRLALQLNERYPIAHHWYGGFLSAMGRHDEAIRHALRARELEPFSLIINTWVGLRHYFARRYELAVDEYQAALQLDAEFPPAHWHLGWAYEQTGRFDEAIEAARTALELSGGNPLYLASLGHAYAIAGDADRAREILRQLDSLSDERHVSAYHTAVIHGALGDVDAAFAWLERAFEERSPWIAYLNVDPRVDPLRSDARFAALLGRARLDF